MFYTTLPQCIISLIYTYDNTYHLIFKRTKKQIHTFGFNTRLQNTIYPHCMKHSQLIGYYKTTFSST